MCIHTSGSKLLRPDTLCLLLVKLLSRIGPLLRACVLLLELVLVLLLAASHQLAENIGLAERVCLRVSCRRLLRGAACLALCLLALVLRGLVLVHIVRLVLLGA